MKTVNMTINGVKRQFKVEPGKVLLDILREDLGLTGAKQSCDRKGQCGACTVVVDSKAVLSCLKKAVDLEGANIITVEGLGTPRNPHLIQEAYVLSGAIQCGFCTPGMIMATKVLLDENPNPSVPEIKKALARNLCRCTGYTKIIDAVRLAGRFIRKETTPAKVRSGMKKGMLGVSHPRPSAMAKSCGSAQFAADIKLKNPLEMAVVHSTEHHAKIKSINTSAAKSMPGVAGIILADDIKGTNRLRLFAPDQPVLCEDVVRTYGDPVAIVAAETRDQARAAAAAVKVEYEPLPVMMTPEESLAAGAYQIHKHSPNLCYTQPQIRGDAGKALKKSKFVVDAKFTTQMNHQAPLEPEVCLAYLEGQGDDETLFVIGRSINIHLHAAMIKEAVGAKNIRYIEPFVGGQFGIKATISSEGLAAAAAMHFKRPIRYIPSLTESMWISSKRHPFSMKVKLGADKEGRLTAFYNEFTVDKGAYFLLGPIIPTRAFHMLNGAYYIENIDAFCKLAYTNNASGGAARGAGPPQVAFALESAMDMLAEKYGIDALEFRKMNLMKPGQARSTGATIIQYPFPELFDAIRPKYEKIKEEIREFNAQNSKIKRGVGIGCHAFGIAEAGDTPGRVAVEVNPDNSITVYAACADPGEGNDSMLAQIAAHMLDLPIEKVHLYTRDTDKTVGMGPSAGSRMTIIGGGALANAVEKLKSAMSETGTRTYDGLKKAGKPVRYEGVREIPGSGHLDPKTGQGDSFITQVLNIQIAEVEVNLESGQVKVIKMTTAVDAGRIINPQNLEGQLEGGMDQGIGYALREEYIHGQTKDWHTFKFPTIGDSVEVDLISRETYRDNGTLGSTGIGEMTMVSTAPAVTNAIYNACGVRIYSIPATPEKIKAGLKQKK
ncbi:MAG TPA: molybdopterin cofactor-binding domain-containing protein [Dehalococcoidales bacterium]|nr:molybdopterin cofactor-binding domain-containing protein [Dehalococcoidales bacterium]